MNEYNLATVKEEIEKINQAHMGKGEIMVQTQIQLSEENMAALEELTKKRNITLSDLIQEAVDNLLRSAPTMSRSERKQRALDIAGRFRSGLGDLSRCHDNYLAEETDA